MEAKDLMIGDLVRVNRDVCIKNDTIVRVCGIDATNRLVEQGLEGSAICVPVDDIDFYSGGIWVKYLDPIPLTPEILEKNGFKDVSTHTLKGCDTYELSFGRDNDQKIIYKLGDYFAYESYDDRWYRLFETQICHRWCVHNLQHALRLCGIDKEIYL